MRFPKLPGRSATDETPANEPASTLTQHAGISAVPIPESVPPPLTSDLTRSIRFTISEPQGYYFEQVETFVQQVIDVLAFYEQADDRWKQFAYEMQVEVDQQAHDAQRLRSEIELFKVQGSPLINSDGSYMTESQNSTLATVSADLNMVKDQLSASEHSRLVGQEEINRLQDLAAMRDQEIAALRAWGEQVIADMQALQAHVVTLEAQLAAPQASPTPPTAPSAASAPAVVTVEPEPVESEPVVVVPVVASLPVDHFEAAASLAPYPAEPGNGDDYDGDDYDGDDYDGDDLQVPLVDVPAVDLAGFDLNDTPAEATPYEQPHTPAVVPTYEPTPEAAEAVGVPVAYEPTMEPPVVEGLVVVDYEEPQFTVAPVATHHDVGVHNVEVHAAAPTLYAPEPLSHEPEVSVPGADASSPEASPAPAVAEESEDDPASGDSAWDIDSELPEGVALPGTGEAAYYYPSATPGAPLETHGVPMGVWAPELDPRITQALAEEASQQQSGEASPA